MTESKSYVFPKTLGACADKLYALREKRASAQRIVDGIEAEEKALKEHLIETLPKSEVEGVTGKVAKVKILRKAIPQVRDYDAFYKFVKQTSGFDMLQKRLNIAAVQERLDAGKRVPGIEIFTAVMISLTKV